MNPPSPESPTPAPPPPPTPQPASGSSGDPGTTTGWAIFLLFAPSLTLVFLGVLSRAIPPLKNGPILVVPLLAALFLGPLITGFYAGQRIARRHGFRPLAQVFLSLGLAFASFLACLPGCATLL